MAEVTDNLCSDVKVTIMVSHSLRGKGEVGRIHPDFKLL